MIGLFSASFINGGSGLGVSAMLAFIGFSAAAVYGKRYMKAVVCVISAAAGMFLYSLHDIAVYERIVKYDGCDVTVTGKITDVSDYSGDSALYRVEGVINGSAAAGVTCFADASFAQIGDIVSFAGKATVPSDTYTFPAKSYYKAKGIYLQINSVKDFRYQSSSFSLKRTVKNYRGYLIGLMKDEMDNDCAAVMSAILLGDKSQIADDKLTLMYRAGIGHIMAVSGLHLSVVCSLLGYVLSRTPFNKYVRFGLFLVPIVSFVMLAGMSNSVIRAAVMIVLVYGARLFKRRADTFNSLGIAVIALTAFSPFAVRDASFLLSAAGVFGIGVAAPVFIDGLKEKWKIGKIFEVLAASFCVMTVVFPVTALFFDEVSVVSPLSNLILLPVCEIVLVCGVIVALTGGIGIIAVPVLKVCEICCRPIIWISGFIGGMRFSYIPLGNDFARFAAIAGVAAAAAFCFLCRKKFAAVKLSVVALAAAMCLINIFRLIPDGKINIAVFKDGSSVSAVVHDKSSACVIDLNKGGGAAETVVKYLNRIGIYNIDAVMLNADVNLSLPEYLRYTELFNIGEFMVPVQDKSLTGGYSEEKISFYSRDGGFLKADGYVVDFKSDGSVLISVGISEIIFYGSDTDIDESRVYSAAVRYSGTDGARDAEAPIIAAMDKKASIALMSGKTVYIGENIKIVIGSDGTVTSGVLK